MKKNRKTTTTVNNQSTSSLPESLLTGEKVAFIFIIVYLFVDLIPSFGAVDVMGAQWFYLAIANLVISACILLNKEFQFSKVVFGISNSLLFKSYMGFFLLSGISIFFAINQVESLVIYSRFIIVTIAFLNISVVLHKHLSVIKYVCQALAIIVLFQCSFILFSFIKEMGTTSIDTIISNLKENSGNKNILAASIIIKLPFIIYCIYIYHGRSRTFFNIVSLTLAVMAVFILNARAAYLALFAQLILFLVFCILHTDNGGGSKRIFNAVKVVLPVLFSFIVAQILLQHSQAGGQPEGYVSTTQYGLVTQRISTITSDQDQSINTRLFLWENALDYILANPITGCGYGNWKIASVKYEKTFLDDFIVSKHVHNDFLEVTAESGILAGILFASLFFLACFNTVKIWYSKTSNDVKVIGVFSLISLTGYFFDAIFNFPAERPVMQTFLAFALALNLAVFMYNIKLVELHKQRFYKPFLILGIVAALFLSSRFSYASFQSMKIQSFTNSDFGKPESILTEEQINYSLPEIPNLGENNAPIDVIKAWYLFKNQKYTDALKITDRSINVNPDLMFNEWLKSVIYYSMNKPDSSFYYAKKGFFNRPRNIHLYTMLAKASIQLNDTNTLIQSFREYNRYRDDAEAWNTYIKSLFIANYDKNEVIRIADSVANVRPNESEIQKIKYFVHGAIAFRDQNFNTAMKNFQAIMKSNPDDNENLENIGLTYFVTRDYSNAVIYLEKTGQQPNQGTGKSEFYLGQSLIALDRKAEGCNYISIAAARNFPGAAQYLNANCIDDSLN